MQVPQAVTDEVNTEIANVRGALQSDNAEDIRSKVSALQTALMKIGSSMAGQSQGGSDQSGGPGAGGAAGEGPSTYDADVKEERK